MTAVIALTASSLPVDVVDVDIVDVDVDVDLVLDGDDADFAPQSTLGVFELDAPILMPPTPQITQMEPAPQVIQIDFELDAPVLTEPTPQISQTYVQLDPPVLVDPLPPQVTQAVVDIAGTADAV
ncbi:hypothetical protein [Kitasatospora sp. NPDC056531]|uniref:hypothetical protein n=1 Tax=Kitasatospora sp. NPDC056531 TaxID=3345856 RepID=UPI0036983AA1